MDLFEEYTFLQKNHKRMCKMRRKHPDLITFEDLCESSYIVNRVKLKCAKLFHGEKFDELFTNFKKAKQIEMDFLMNMRYETRSMMNKLLLLGKVSDQCEYELYHCKHIDK